CFWTAVTELGILLDSQPDLNLFESPLAHSAFLMNLTLQAALAVSPIALAALLLIGFRIAARWAMPLVYLTAVGIGYFSWQVPGDVLAAASVEGLVKAIEILLIVFAALGLLNTLEQSGGIASIRRSFHH